MAATGEGVQVLDNIDDQGRWREKSSGMKAKRCNHSITKTEKMQ